MNFSKLLSVCVTQLDVRGRNKKEKFGSLVKLVTKSVDEVLVTGQKVRKLPQLCFSTSKNIAGKIDTYCCSSVGHDTNILFVPVLFALGVSCRYPFIFHDSPCIHDSK